MERYKVTYLDGRTEEVEATAYVGMWHPVRGRIARRNRPIEWFEFQRYRKGSDEILRGLPLQILRIRAADVARIDLIE